MPSLRLGGTGTTATRSLAALAIVIASVVLPTGSATANLESWRWPTREVCVRDGAALPYWPLRVAAMEYSKAADLSVVTAPDCTGYRQQVSLEQYAARDGRCGVTTTWWDGDRVRGAAIRLNTYYWSCLSSPDRRAHVVSHELGHALGLPHTGREDSVMSVSTWSYDHVPYPTAHDFEQLERSLRDQPMGPARP
jgi:hypothetical protein